MPEIEPHVIENEAIVKLASYSHRLLSEKHSLVGTNPPILGEKRSYYFQCLEWQAYFGPNDYNWLDMVEDVKVVHFEKHKKF